MLTPLPVVFVTFTDTTTVFGPTGSTSLVSQKTSDAIPTLTRGVSTAPIMKTSSMPSGSASIITSATWTSSYITSSSDANPRLPSGWPSPVPKNTTPNPPKHNDTVAIITLLFLVLLCLIFVLFLIFFLYQKWKGDCSKCRTLQQTVEKYVTGQLVPISKQTCKDRDSYFAEQEGKREMEANSKTTWSLDYNSGPEYRHSVSEVHVAKPSVIPHPAPMPRGSSEAGPSRPCFITSANARDSDFSSHNEKPCSNRKRSSASPTQYAPYNGGGLKNPYRMNIIPNDEEQPRKFATFGDPYEDVRSKGASARPDSCQPSDEHISAENLANMYRNACFEANRSSNPFKKDTDKLASSLDGQIQQKHRSGAYGRFTPPVSLAGGFQNVDLESQEENEEEEQKPAWKLWHR